MSRIELYPENAVIMAPLSGFTDAAYRRSLYRHGCKFAFTEMVDVSAMAYKTQSSFFMLERSAEDKFLGCQLVGSSVEHAAVAMQELKAYDFDLIDLNLGCPVPKVAKKGAGAALGRNFELAKAILHGKALAVLPSSNRPPLGTVDPIDLRYPQSGNSGK